MEENDCLTAKLEQWIHESERIVFFGGAGVSTESGIPDFRGPGGLCLRPGQQESFLPVETILSRDFFDAYPDVFFHYYRQYLLYPQAKPNAAHIRLAQLEQSGRLRVVITQNIDGLHQAAGSKNVLELHGSAKRNICLHCRQIFTLEEIMPLTRTPVCSCGGRIKPDIVLYGEELDQHVIRSSIKAIAEADLLIIGGTSLSVYPAAGLIDYRSDCRTIMINQTKTPLDNRVDLVIRAPIGHVLGRTARTGD